MKHTAAFYSQPASSPATGCSRAQLAFSVTALMFLGASFWKLLTWELPPEKFVLGMLASLLITLGLVAAGFIISLRGNPTA